MNVAQTIFKQLGGSRFTAMTGAKNFRGGHNHLTFDLPKTPHYVKNKSTCVQVTLNSQDLYDIEFWRIWGMNPRHIETVNDVFVGDLQRTFTAKTGLDTHL